MKFEKRNNHNGRNHSKWSRNHAIRTYILRIQWHTFCDTRSIYCYSIKTFYFGIHFVDLNCVLYVSWNSFFLHSILLFVLLIRLFFFFLFPEIVDLTIQLANKQSNLVISSLFSLLKFSNNTFSTFNSFVSQFWTDVLHFSHYSIVSKNDEKIWIQLANTSARTSVSRLCIRSMDRGKR